MKKRTDVVADAAMTFAQTWPRRATPQTTLDSVLPEAAKETAELKPFEQKTPVPRHISKVLCSTLIERVLQGRARAVDVVGVLVSTERDYVLAVLDEVYAWAAEQGVEVPNVEWVDQSVAPLLTEEARA